MRLCASVSSGRLRLLASRARQRPRRSSARSRRSAFASRRGAGVATARRATARCPERARAIAVARAAIGQISIDVEYVDGKNVRQCARLRRAAPRSPAFPHARSDGEQRSRRRTARPRRVGSRSAARSGSPSTETAVGSPPAESAAARSRCTGTRHGDLRPQLLEPARLADEPDDLRRSRCRTALVAPERPLVISDASARVDRLQNADRQQVRNHRRAPDGDEREAECR